MRAALSLLILSVAAPAGAQIWDGGRSAVRDVPAPPPSLVDRDLGDIDRAIRAGRRSGDLTRAEARQLRAESAAIGRVARQYRGGGPIAADTGFLEQRALMLRDRVATARNRSR